MANIIFSEGSGLNDSVFGKCQMPIKMFLEQRGEAFEQESLLPELFCMDKSSNFGDMLTSMTAMQGPQPVGENGDYPSDGMQEGYQKMLTYMTWKDKFSISQEMIEDGKVMDMSQKPRAFITAHYRTRELFGACLFANAMMGNADAKFRGKSFDIKTADGSNLFATNHKPKVSGANQSNMFSNAFSQDSLSRVENAMQLFRGDNDNILDVAPDTILIPADPDLKQQVFEVIGADKDPTSSNNGFNYHFDRWNVICWPYLNQFLKGDNKPWVLLDSTYNKNYKGAVWIDRLALSIKSQIDENDANTWKGRARWNAAFHDFRFAAIGGITGGTTLGNA